MGEIAEALRRADGENPDDPHYEKSAKAPLHVDLRSDETASGQPASADRRSASQPRPSAREASIRPSLRAHVVVGDVDDEWSPAQISIREPQGNAAQQSRRLAFRIRELTESRRARSIVITSAQIGDGKTTTACNLAVQLAKLDQALNVVLVDLDLRRPSVAAAMGVQARFPVDGVLEGKYPVADAILETNVTGLSLLPSAQGVHDPESLLANSNLRRMIQDLESRFDLVVIDSPPLLAVTDAQLILRHTASALIVARAGLTTVKSVRRAAALLPSEKILGSFLNSNPNAQQLGSYGDYEVLPPDQIDPNADLETTHVD